jgi:oligopeptidase B
LQRIHRVEENGKLLNDVLTDITENFEWANDSQTLFYTKQDPVTLRASYIYRHKLGQPDNKDILVFEEKDDTFHTRIGKTKSKQYLMIGSFSKDTSEFRILNADHPEEPFTIFSPRLKGREYYLEHHADQFIIRTNDNAINFKLMQCPVYKTEFKNWQPLSAYDPDSYVEDFQVFDNFYIVQERKLGLSQLKIHPFNKQEPYTISFDEPDYSIYLNENPEYDADGVRFTFNSLKTPRSVYDFDTKTKTKTLKKQYEVLGGFNSNNYETQRVFAKARDGAEVPISLIYRKNKFVRQQNPLFLVGYGSYGVTYDPDFNPFIISLLDRGFVVAIAHIRGGSELGRSWYFDGKLLNKKNTFYDFIDSAEYLVKEGFAAKDKLYATGASAGGLLMGAVINMRPDLFKGVIAEVPFVDLMNTMLDPSIPLTTGEYAEWGNPNEKIYYDYMLSYSPYDNIRHTNYPNLLVIGAYHDSQVQYWESAKWVAKLRDEKSDDHVLLLQTLMNASHGGVSDRYKEYEQKAFKYAFLLTLENKP